MDFPSRNVGTDRIYLNHSSETLLRQARNGCQEVARRTFFVGLS